MRRPPFPHLNVCCIEMYSTLNFNNKGDKMIRFDNDSMSNLATNLFNKNLREFGGTLRLDAIVTLSMVEFANEYFAYKNAEIKEK